VRDTLHGYTVGVTADRRAAEQIQMLERRGATCLHGPTLASMPLRPDAEVAEATRRIIENPPDITILTTGAGVRGWFAAADSMLLGEDLRAAMHASLVWARGPKAHGAAITVGLEVVWTAPSATLDEVVLALESREVAGRRIAIQLDGDPDKDIVARIEALGATVEPVPIYRWTVPDEVTPAQALVRSIADRTVDAVTFTARPAVENFVDIATDMGVLDDVRGAVASGMQVFAVGSYTGGIANDFGLGPARYPESGRLGSMVLQLTESLSSSAVNVELAGRAVTLRGRLLEIDGDDHGLLTSRERRVFCLLASRPGVVFSKTAMLESIWRGESVDTHTVEVTVGRLRRRLGEAGEGVETVFRRGYRLSAA